MPVTQPTSSLAPMAPWRRVWHGTLIAAAGLLVLIVHPYQLGLTIGEGCVLVGGWVALIALVRALVLARRARLACGYRLPPSASERCPWCGAINPLDLASCSGCAGRNLPPLPGQRRASIAAARTHHDRVHLIRGLVHDQLG